LFTSSAASGTIEIGGDTGGGAFREDPVRAGVNSTASQNALQTGGACSVTTPIGTSTDEAHSVAIQSDGKIVAAGASSNGSRYDFALVRYNTDWTLDTTFNGTGKVTTSVGTDNASAFAVAIQTDGKIVAAGFSIGSNADFALVRYNADGTLDTSFNGTGKVTTPIGSGNDFVYSVTIQSDGKIVAAGSRQDGSIDAVLVRYNANGTLDTSFNGTGIVTPPINSNDTESARSVVIQTDGKILAGTAKTA
jgi:uncharacterized delta-60 repeat protein